MRFLQNHVDSIQRRNTELCSCCAINFSYFDQSGGSGSESGIWIEKPIKSRTVEDSDNNNGSNDEDDTESIGLDFRGESDSGTQV